MIGMLIVIICLVLAFGVFLPNFDRNPASGLWFFICMVIAAGMLGALRA